MSSNDKLISESNDNCLEYKLIEWTGVTVDDKIGLEHIELRELIAAIAYRVVVQHFTHSGDDLVDRQIRLKASAARNARQIAIRGVHRLHLTVRTGNHSLAVQCTQEHLTLALILFGLQPLPRPVLLLQELVSHLCGQLVRLLCGHRPHVLVVGHHVLQLFVDVVVFIFISGAGAVLHVVDIYFSHPIHE